MELVFAFIQNRTNLKITVYCRVEQVTVENTVCDWNTDGVHRSARCLDMVRVQVDVQKLLPTIGDCPIKPLHQANTHEHHCCKHGCVLVFSTGTISLDSGIGR